MFHFITQKKWEVFYGYFSRSDVRISLPEILAFVVILGSALFVCQITFKRDDILKYDAMRYIAYSVSLNLHGVFGLSSSDVHKKPEPGNANAPVYPAMVAGLMAVNKNFKDTLICVVELWEEAENCPKRFGNFIFLQNVIGLFSLFLLFLLTIQLTRNRMAAWLATMSVIPIGVFTEYANTFMTEILIIPAFFGLLLCIIQLNKNYCFRWMFFAGLILGLMALIRPSYLYLFYAFVVFVSVYAFFVRTKKSFYMPLILLFGFALLTAPWAVRNKIHFDSYVLTSGGYAEAILSQRVAYNHMSWGEWAASFVYWFPDGGESISRKLFKPEKYEKLGWGEGSYYQYGVNELYSELLEGAGDRDRLFSHIIQTEILSDPFKHMAVSLPLAWRGALIAKYWGVVGFVVFLVFLVQTLRRGVYSYALASLPLWFMVALHAGISVSIPRYNLPLMALYAPAMAWYAQMIIMKILSWYNTRYMKAANAASA